MEPMQKLKITYGSYFVPCLTHSMRNSCYYYFKEFYAKFQMVEYLLWGIDHTESTHIQPLKGITLGLRGDQNRMTTEGVHTHRAFWSM